MSKVKEVRRLIAEIHKRPALWDFQHLDYKDRQCVPSLWNEVARIVGADVVVCKRKWKNLRDAYRAEVKRTEQRIERDKVFGVYDANTKYTSNWVYFPSLSFISDSQHNYSHSIVNERTIPNSNDNNHYDEIIKKNMYDEHFDNIVVNIKSEPTHDMVNDLNLLGGDDDAANEMLFEKFQNIAIPQAVRRLSSTFSMNNAFEEDMTTQEINLNVSTSNVHTCPCSKLAKDHVNFLQDLGRQEKKLIRSTRQDITRSNKLDHIGDSDYNFLVSFLPQMKKLSELQNLKFRAKMCEAVLNILTPAVTKDSLNSSLNKQQYLTHNAANGQQSMNMVHSTSSNNLI